MLAYWVAQEMLTWLVVCWTQDLVDQHLRERKETPAMQAVMGGAFAQQIICRSVPYRSEKEEDFYQVLQLSAPPHRRSNTNGLDVLSPLSSNRGYCN